MKFITLTAAAALTALLLAGCGGDNKAVTTSTAAASAATTAASSATSSATTATTSGSSSDSGSTTTPSFSGSSNNEFCQTARDLENSDIGTDLSSGGGNLKDDLQKIRSALDDLKGSAPSEIKADVNTLASAFDKLDAFYAKYDYDQTKLLAAAQKDPTVVQQATSALSDPAFEAAASRITAYGTQVCGFTDDSSSTSA